MNLFNDKAYWIVDKHARELFHSREEDDAIAAEFQEIRMRIHALKVRKRANEQLKDALVSESERAEQAREREYDRREAEAVDEWRGANG